MIWYPVCNALIDIILLFKGKVTYLSKLFPAYQNQSFGVLCVEILKDKLSSGWTFADDLDNDGGDDDYMRTFIKKGNMCVQLISF